MANQGYDRHHTSITGSNSPPQNRSGLRWRPFSRCRLAGRLFLLLSLTILCHIAAAETPPTPPLRSQKSDINIFYNVTLCARHRRDVGRSREVKIEEEDEDIEIPEAEPLDLPPPPQTVPHYGASGTCGGCRPREQLRKQSLELIKDEILSKLGMSTPPNITGRFRPEHGMNHILEKYETDTRRNQYHMRRNSHSHHNPMHHSGVHWVMGDGDADVQMQGDAPADRGGVKREGSKEFLENPNYVGSHMNSSDNSFSDSFTFQEGEVYTEEEDNYHVHTKKVVSFSLPHPKLRHIQPDIQYFQFNDKVRSNRVKRVVLWVYIRGTDVQDNGPLPSGTHLNISIYKMHRGSGKSNDSPILVPVIGRITQPIPPGAGAWMNLEYGELEKLVSEWFRTPQANMGLLINATDRQGTNLAVTSHQQSDSDMPVPFLEVYLTDAKKHRKKRTLGLNCNENSNETRCCRYPLTVDFEEFGWDWIIAPKKYEANFCDGECPMVFMQSIPHTHLSQLSTLSRAARTGPCCAPRKLSPISMLYFDSNMNILYGTLPSMVVDRCGCI